MLLVLLQVEPQLYPCTMLVLPNADHWSFNFVRSQTQNSDMPTFSIILQIFLQLKKWIYSPSKLSRGRWMFYSYKMWEESG